MQEASGFVYVCAHVVCARDILGAPMRLILKNGSHSEVLIVPPGDSPPSYPKNKIKS